MNALVETLTASLPRLPERDRKFAQSLCDQATRRDLSDKQMMWVKIFVESLDQAERPMQTDSVTAVVDLINRNMKAKFPKLRVLTHSLVMQLTRAGEASRFPGSINVYRLDGMTEVTRSFASKTWLGRVHLDGRFENGRGHDVVLSEIMTALRYIGADPEKAAREYGRRMGHCCFCHMALDDERSLEAGYGPTCAKNYNLTWGKK